MKAYWGSGGIAPLILWPQHYEEVSGQLHAPADLPPSKEPLLPINMEVSLPKLDSGHSVILEKLSVGLAEWL